MFKAIAATVVLGLGAIGLLSGCGQGYGGEGFYGYEEPYFYNEPEYARPFYYRDDHREFRGERHEFRGGEGREFRGGERGEFHGGEHFGGGEHGRR